MKTNKIYGKGKALIVCFRGGHYTSPDDTNFNEKNRVSVEEGKLPDTVLVGGTENWALKERYLSGEPKARKTKVEKAPALSEEAREGIFERILKVAPCTEAAALMMVMFNNWLDIKNNANIKIAALFGGLNYQDAEATKAVRALGLALMQELSSEQKVIDLPTDSIEV